MEKSGLDIHIEDMNPTFLFTWKGTRRKDKDEEHFHRHDHLELAFIFSGEGKYRFEDGICSVKEGDLLIINPGVRHQALACPEAEVPATEFFSGGFRYQAGGLPRQYTSCAGGGTYPAYLRGIASEVI